MRVSKSLKLPWERLYQSPPFGNSFSAKLWKCDKDIAPSRMTEDVKLRCEITCPLETPFHELPIHMSKGVTYRRLQFELEVIPSGGNLLDFIAYMDGRRVAQKKVVVTLNDKQQVAGVIKPCEPQKGGIFHSTDIILIRLHAYCYIRFPIHYQVTKRPATRR